MKDQLVASRLTIFALLVFGALPIYAQNPDLVSHAQPSCGTATAQFHVTASNTLTEPQVDPGKALIYLVEEQKLHYHDVTVRVGLDGKWVGRPAAPRICPSLLSPASTISALTFFPDF
jgi:hypothetical protein